VPTAIFNGERDGAIKMGDIWVEVVELFMSVLRVGGLKVVSTSCSPVGHPLMTGIDVQI